MLRLIPCLFISFLAVPGVPALAAQSQQEEQGETGTWELIPLPDSKVPAAWVLNTQTGQTYLCGPSARHGEAEVACIQAKLPGVGGQQ